MSKYLPFILSEEIFRLNAASPYVAFVLKTKIEEYFDATQIRRDAKQSMSYGSKFKYFDTEKMDVDGIFIEKIGDKTVSGKRLSDCKQITTPLESVSLTEPVDEFSCDERPSFDGFDAPYLSKVAIGHWNHSKTYIKGQLLMLGYLIRHSWNTSKVRLLGGELLTLNGYNHGLYEPTPDELNLFEKVENEQYFIDKEWNRTVSLAKEFTKDIDMNLKPSVNKLTRLLLTRGCTQENITKAINLANEDKFLDVEQHFEHETDGAEI